MTDAERLRRVRGLMDEIEAEASAFSEYAKGTNDAFIRIRNLARTAYKAASPLGST